MGLVAFIGNTVIYCITNYYLFEKLTISWAESSQKPLYCRADYAVFVILLKGSPWQY